MVALQGLDLLVGPGEVVAIVGRSGSGKTTLMNVLAGVVRPTAGLARIAGTDLTRVGDGELHRYRREVVGYMIQHPHANLDPDLNGKENVLLPMVGKPGDGHADRGAALLEAMGIGHLASAQPAELSGGEAQRLAAAVALANSPQLLLADEPTAELDSQTARSFLRDLRAVLAERRAAAVIVTHDRDVEQHADRVVQLRDGRTSTETTWRDEGGELVADEVLILDRAGRLQLPRRFVEAAGFKDRVRAHLDGAEVRLRPAGEDHL